MSRDIKDIIVFKDSDQFTINLFNVDTHEELNAVILEIVEQYIAMHGGDISIKLDALRALICAQVDMRSSICSSFDGLKIK